MPGRRSLEDFEAAITVLRAEHEVAAAEEGTDDRDTTSGSVTSPDGL